MNNEEQEDQCAVFPHEGGEIFSSDDLGNKRKFPGEEEEDARGYEGPDQKKRKSVGVSGCSQGTLAFKEDGKKYYQCKIMDCVKYAVQRGLCISHGATVKKYPRKRCIVEGCGKIARGKSGKCLAHGGDPVKKCSVEGCQNNQKQGGKCKRHGAKCTIKRCSFSRCNKFAQRRGVCIKHGKELAAARMHEATLAAAAASESAEAEATSASISITVPALPPVAALPPLAATNDNEEAASPELSQVLCLEIGNEVPTATASTANDGDGDVQPPSVAKMPTMVAATNDNIQNTTDPNKKKRARKLCVVNGCDKIGRGKSARCVRHGGTPVKKCSFDGCQNNAKQGGKCKRHGAELNEKPKICIFPDCPNLVRRNGVCVRHGAKLPSCSVPGCTNNAVRRTLCIKHGANSIGPNLPGGREYKIVRK